MKKIIGFMALAGGLGISLTGCSTKALDPNVVTQEMVHSYVNIRISTPGVSGTRAPGDGDGNYEYGEETENKVTNYLLLFYDVQGNLVGTADRGLGDDQKQMSGQNVAVIKTGTAEVTLTEGSQMPTQLVAVINPDDDLIEALVQTNLTGASELIIGDDASVSVEDLWKSDHFVMNNSVYFKDGQTITMATPIEGLLYSDQEQAKKDLEAALKPEATAEDKAKLVNVYVERLAVKGMVTNTTPSQTPVKAKDVDGQEYELEFVIDCYDVTAIAKESYFVKHIRAINEYNDPFKSWMNAYHDFRSYWAQSRFADDKLTIATNFPVVGDHESYLLHYKSTDEVLGEGEFEGKGTGKTLGTADYFAENTFRGTRISMETLGDNPYVAATSFLVNGHYAVTGGSNAAKYNDGNDFYITSYYEGGETYYRIYSEDEAISSFGDQIKNHKIVATAPDGSALNASKLGLVHRDKFFDAAGVEQGNNPANRMTIQLVDADGNILTDPAGLYYFDEADSEWKAVETEVKLQEINADIEKKIVGSLMMYNSGRAFFYIPIKHYTGNLGDEATANFPKVSEVKTGNFGVVRNHVYNMTINKITGLGIGVGPDPSVPELPDPKPIQNYYINAQLNVLQWHVMGQSVDL